MVLVATADDNAGTPKDDVVTQQRPQQRDQAWVRGDFIDRPVSDCAALPPVERCGPLVFGQMFHQVSALARREQRDRTMESRLPDIDDALRLRVASVNCHTRRLEKHRHGYTGATAKRAAWKWNTSMNMTTPTTAPTASALRLPGPWPSRLRRCSADRMANTAHRASAPNKTLEARSP